MNNPMKAPQANQPSPDIAAAAKQAAERDFPNKTVGRVIVCNSTPTAIIVRVFLPIPKMIPSPYAIYRVELPSLAARQLEGDDARPFRILNYR
jgi:hypothetical protein